ncbi:MAG: hypothetical protein ACQET5_07790 [Halobacteriota archaeon]|uniref:hypothetical protein n=1 Tax=Natronomonas sp. TaxID=2184060 RepID=UPI003976EA73
MSSEPDATSRPFVESAVAGVAAWVLGYVLTYLLVATDIESSPLNQLIEFFEGESPVYELVGWVFYNAHLVDISYSGLGPFSPPRSFIGGDGFTPFLYVIPPALLIVAGLALGRYSGATEAKDGAIAGALVVPGYLVAAIVGTVLFTVDVGDASGAPDLIPAILIAGFVYPVFFGAIGGVIASVTASSS